MLESSLVKLVSYVKVGADSRLGILVKLDPIADS